MCYIMLMISSLHDKRLRQRQYQDQRIIGICRRCMVLSDYMISWEWMGYLKKLDKDPNLYMTRFHRYEINTMFILTLLCGNSAAAYHARGVSALYVGQCSINKISLATRHTYFSYKSYGKSDINCIVKMSDISEFDELPPSTC